MAQVLPAKRSRGFTGPIQPRKKRPRVSVEPSESDDSSRSSPVENTQDVTADDEEDEAAYIRATQIVQKSLKRSQNKKNVPAEAGIIEEVRCTNFMCHEQLTVPLGPLINFIIGHNGSGKSAVLTALTICLGGKASATNRGQNLKSFIKAGREYCNLAVKIKNRGAFAYRPEVYGDSIIVERHFNLAGTSGFKLKDRSGKIVSVKKADVEDVIDAFAMQLDNPMNVLTQDMARQFLNDSNARDKYRFFLKGTQLEALDNDYRQIAAELEEQEAKAQEYKGHVEIYQKRYEEAVAKARNAENIKRMKKKEQGLAYQAAWAQVQAEEGELKTMDSEIERIGSLIENRKSKADTESANYARCNEALEDAKEEIQRCDAEMQPTQDDIKEKKEKWGEVKARVFRLKGDERKIISGISASTKTVALSQSRIDEQKELQAQADNGIHAQKLQEYEEAKAMYEQRKSEWEIHGEGVHDLAQELAQAKSNKAETDTKTSKKRGEEKASDTKIRELKQVNRSWIDSYRDPKTLAYVLREIEAETRFKTRPVGPIGRHVELLKPQWGSILEKSFGPALEAFVVTNKADQSLLSAIMKRANHQAPIYIPSSTTPIDTSGQEPDSELLTWMRALKINNDLVRNQLIINLKIEKIVLIEKRLEAQEFMDRPAFERKNVAVCFSMSDMSRRMGHSFTTNESGTTSTFSYIDEYKGQFRMQADKGPQIQDEEENLASIRREIQTLQADARDKLQHVNDCQASLAEHAKEKKTLKVKMDRAQDDMTRLEGEVAASIPDAAMVEQLEVELKEAQANLEADERQYEDLTTALDEANTESRTHKTEVDRLSRVLDEVQYRSEQVKARLATLSQKRDEALRAKNKALDEVQAAETNKTEWENKRAAQQLQLDDYLKSATEISPRVEVPEGQTFASLLKKLEVLQKERVRAEKQLGGSEQELYEKAVEAQKAWHEAKKSINSAQAVQDKLKQALVTRKRRWLEFRQRITTRARIIFNYLLSERQFRGSLNVDHANQRLDIEVQPDITVQSAAGRQTKTLSGGEKSFSTICLLLALWDAMGSPIRCLDEFDVFMDSVNRDVSMTLIIGAARRAVGRQYILITPQSMNNRKVHSMDDVKIIRMEDPERGQTALKLG
ncbi:unnamed protein product [Periconia digitata]|uniref:RecF/RecN/SMC N-terminal domain-containing protein n=1 Tax=Periconia digitata TaxID=1303443 RepID=A0A9W4UNA7_9PLEO|nr:unnamed protein product [Periconia digitata]